MTKPTADEPEMVVDADPGQPEQPEMMEIPRAVYDAMTEELNGYRENSLTPAQIAMLRQRAEMVPALEEKAAQANRLQMTLNDVQQEHDRLKGLLVGAVEIVDSYSYEYPDANLGVQFFAGQLSEEQLNAKRSEWNEQRGVAMNEFDSWANDFKTQATV